MLGSTSIPLWVVHGALHSSEKSCGEPYCFLFIMVRHGGKSFSDVYMCIHRTIGGFMNVVCVLFFFFFLFSCLFVNCFSLYSGMVSVHVVVFVPFTDHIG